MKWYEDKGESSDIVLATRVQLARNLKDYPFTQRLRDDEKDALNELVRRALTVDDDLEFIEMKKLSKYEIVSLAEKHMITPEFASNTSGRALLFNENEGVSIMLCEEDHVKIQVVLPGLDPKNAFEKAEIFDERLENCFDIAFNNKLGYLTQSPANIGTGLRASVILHLPALNSNGEMFRLASTVSKLGLTLRSTYSDRGQTIGDIFTLSNQVTLGISEEAAIDNLRLITSQIVSQEKNARTSFIEKDSTLDRIYRAFGILSNAYLISATEALDLLSLVRLGANEGKLDIPLETLTKLFIEVQSATLSASQSETLTVPEREKLRADLIKEAIKA